MVEQFLSGDRINSISARQIIVHYSFADSVPPKHTTLASVPSHRIRNMSRAAMSRILHAPTALIKIKPRRPSRLLAGIMMHAQAIRIKYLKRRWMLEVSHLIFDFP
jgi:hypothetical protein